MKRTVWSLICGAAVLSLGAPLMGTPKLRQRFTLTIAAPEGPVKAGNALGLPVAVRNTRNTSNRPPGFIRRPGAPSDQPFHAYLHL